MKVIVIGLGEVGHHITNTLSAQRHDVTVVDRDPVRVEAAQGELDAMVVAGNGASPKFLRELGAGDADLLGATYSGANFVFTRHPQHGGAKLAAALRQQGVLVRRFAQPERIADYLRISIGDEAQTDRLLEALRNILADD